jgi:hypothetical protein
VSVVKSLRHEIHLFRSAWQQIETFLDRIDEARERDEEHAKKTRALILVAAALENEQRLLTGVGLDLPAEVAQRHGLSVGAEVTKLLPGAFDLELAVANSEGKESNGDIINLEFVALLAPKTLYHRYDETQGKAVDFVAPLYSSPLAWNVPYDVTTSNVSLFDFDARRSVGDPSSVVEPNSWSALRATRRNSGEKLKSCFRDCLDNAQGSGFASVDRQALQSSLQALVSHANGALKDLEEARVALAADELDLGPSSSSVQDAKSHLKARREIYSAALNALLKGGPDLTAKLSAVTALASTLEPMLYGFALPGSVDGALDDEVASRIAYPDGTLRMLRLLEWTLVRSWDFRAKWFESRTKRHLQPLLFRRLLRGFALGMWRAYLHLPTGAFIPTGLAVDPARPAALSASYLQVAPRPNGSTWDFSQVAPGQVAHVDGPRRALVVLLGDASMTGRRDTTRPVETLQRLQIGRLRVSVSKSTGAGDVPGMLISTEVNGPVAKITVQSTLVLSDDDVRNGTVKGRPQDDGVVQELVSLWSKLCLVLGTTAVGNLAKDPALVPPNAAPPASLPTELPSALPRAVRVPLARSIKPHERRLVIDLKALRKAYHDAGHWLPDDAVPIIARPGEMMLLRGADDKQSIWQGAVEVVSVTRMAMSAVEDEQPSKGLGNLICCDGPGDALVVEVLDTPFPVELSIHSGAAHRLVLHRDFKGFGLPSLATQVVLPAAMDPSPETAAEDAAVYRGLELNTAWSILDAWMWA